MPARLATLTFAALLPAIVPAADAPAEYRRASLIERPPFAKSDRRSEKTVDGGPLELRGFFTAGNVVEASVTRTETKESRWIRLGDSTSPWVLESADPAAGTATVRFEGSRLNLRLARPEVPKIDPAAEQARTEQARPDAARDNNSRRPRLSTEARNAFRKAMGDAMQKARSDHPEYFDGSQLSAEQSQARSEYMRSVFTRAREEVSKNFPDDSAAFQEMGARGRGGRSAGEPREPGDRNPSEPPNPAPTP